MKNIYIKIKNYWGGDDGGGIGGDGDGVSIPSSQSGEVIGTTAAMMATMSPMTTVAGSTPPQAT